jgi:MFS family permease
MLFVKEHVASGDERRVLTNFRDVLRGRYLRFLLVVAIFSVGAYNFSFILLKTGELGLIAASIPLAFAVINTTHTAAAAPAGALSDMVGRKVVLGFGYGIFGMASLLAATLPQGVLFAFLLAAVYGVYVGIIETIPRAMVPDYVDEGLEGTAYGLYYLVVGTFFFVANNVLGLLWGVLGSNTAFLFPVATSVIAIVALAVSRI